MKITVSEALDLKKELAAKVMQAQRDLQNCPVVETTQNGVVTNPITESYETKLLKLATLLGYSRELNDTIAAFNVKKGIASMVRYKKNLELVNQQMAHALTRAVPSQSKQFIVVGNERVEVSIVNKIIVDVEKIKKQIRVNQKHISKTQAEIHLLNTHEIELSFDEESL